MTAAKLAKGQTACGISGTYTNDGTVSASHVLKDKVCYSNGSRIVGTMNSISPTTGDKLNATGVTTDSSYTYFGVTSNSYLNGVSYIRAANSTIASKVGLTSDILASGKTVLGVSGNLTSGVLSNKVNYKSGIGRHAGTVTVTLGWKPALIFLQDDMFPYEVNQWDSPNRSLFSKLSSFTGGVSDGTRATIEFTDTGYIITPNSQKSYNYLNVLAIG